MTDTTKECTTCRETKPVAAFHKRASGRVERQCLVCVAEVRRGVYALAVLCGLCTTCRKVNAMAGNTRCAPCREYMAAASAKHRAKDPEAARTRSRAAYQADPTKGRAATVKWRQENPDKFREANREQNRRNRAREQGVLIIDIRPEDVALRASMFGGLCWICRGPSNEMDHVKPLSKGGPHCLSNMRPICSPCNNRKRAQWPFNKGDHP